MRREEWFLYLHAVVLKLKAVWEESLRASGSSWDGDLLVGQGG